jgi:hypothetical protein
MPPYVRYINLASPFLLVGPKKKVNITRVNLMCVHIVKSSSITAYIIIETTA